MRVARVWAHQLYQARQLLDCFVLGSGSVQAAAKPARACSRLRISAEEAGMASTAAPEVRRCVRSSPPALVGLWWPTHDAGAAVGP
jgi:hypothetical protein